MFKNRIARRLAPAAAVLVLAAAFAAPAPAADDPTPPRQPRGLPCSFCSSTIRAAAS
jgi:hypothetical protein